MQEIRIKNLRCLEDTGRIEIKPVSFLVGANSSGKSSFLRVFPLIRQSTETQTLSGLLLNEGDVNFGFFDEAIRKGANPEEMALEFSFVLERGLYHGASLSRFILSTLPIRCEVTYKRRSNNSRYPYPVRILIQIENKNSQTDGIEIVTTEDQSVVLFKVNEFVAKEELPSLRLVVGRGIIPNLLEGIESDSNEEKISLSDSLTLQGSFQKRLLEESQNHFHGRTNTSTRLNALRDMGFGSPIEMLEKARSNSDVGSWALTAKYWTVDSIEYKRIRNLIIASHCAALLESVNLYISQFAQNIHYFAPVRAGVQRDYLSRDVQVQRVEPSGGNVAMVLSSLGPKGLREFRDWMKSHFGFEVFPQMVGDGARVSLRMKETESGAEFNLADMGFGFSQMLPFLVQIWREIADPSTSRRPRVGLYSFSTSINKSGIIVAIEQPELHLHPALQAKLADLFLTISKVSAEKGRPIRFLLETHSSTMIERVGELIESGRAKEEDIQVVLFERIASDAGVVESIVRTAKFNSKGVLIDWPWGFLAAPIEPVSLS